MIENWQDRHVRQEIGVLSTQVGPELVLMNPDLGEYYTLDAIAADIWRRMEHPVAVADLLHGLASEYRGDPAAIRADTFALLDALAQKRLILIEP